VALTNSQYDYFMRTYEKRQLDNENRLRGRFDEVYKKIPRLQTLDCSISELSVRQARKLLDGDSAALTVLKDDLHLLFEEKRLLLEQAGYPEDYLELSYTCSDCKDTGYIGDEKCHCFKKAIIDFLYTQSNLQEVLEKENFNTLSMEYYSESHKDPLTGRTSREAMETALKSCLEFTRNFQKDFRNLLIYGDTGVGKTFLTHCIAKELLEQTFSVIYFTASRLFDIFAKKQFDKDEAAALDYEHIYDCDLLIIDDLGTEFSNAFTTSQLFVCLNERLLRKKAVIISTNLSLDDLNTLYSERVFSRITSAYTVLRMTGDDIRIQKKLMGRL
jgi:DNA replication protein DnaC